MKTTPFRFCAEIWWAFKKSDYWPDKLKTFPDTIRSYTSIVKQYYKWYADIPAYKCPHRKKIGIPASLIREGRLAVPLDEYIPDLVDS